jgi:hypothetical protein
MSSKKLRVGIYVFAGTLLLALLLPGFCTCSTCVVSRVSPKPCDCTVLGIYLGRKVSAFLAEPRELPLDTRTPVVEGRDCRIPSLGELQTEIRNRR